MLSTRNVFMYLRKRVICCGYLRNILARKESSIFKDYVRLSIWTGLNNPYKALLVYRLFKRDVIVIRYSSFNCEIKFYDKFCCKVMIDLLLDRSTDFQADVGVMRISSTRMVEHVFRLISNAVFDVCTRFVHTRFDIVLIQRCFIFFFYQNIFFLIPTVPNRTVAECKKICQIYRCLV